MAAEIDAHPFVGQVADESMRTAASAAPILQRFADEPAAISAVQRVVESLQIDRRTGRAPR